MDVCTDTDVVSLRVRTPGVGTPEGNAQHDDGSETTMSDSTALTTTPPQGTALHTSPGPRVLAEFTSYPDAQRLVDQLSDDGFPVEHVRIVGNGIHSVEQVTGRLTKGRAALAGAASGAWFGLFIGLLFALFTIGLSWLTVVLGTALFGAFWGALFGFVAHWATRGRRDFASVERLEARRYTVEVDATHAGEAARVAGLA